MAVKPTVADPTAVGPVQRHRPDAKALLPDGLITAFWVLLGVLMTALLLLATLVLVRSGIFTARKLTDEQTKSLWAFLGVAMGAAVTLLGSLLTEQGNRRTSALTREAGEREQVARDKQQALAQEAEERLITDTVARILELITVDGGHAPRARVAGAIATLMQLRGGTIAVRILGELWKDNAVDSDTAVWLIDRILLQYPAGASEREVQDAVSLLVINAAKLVPGPNDPDQTWYVWPSAVTGQWAAHLPLRAKDALIVASVRVLLAREVAYWANVGDAFPVDMLTVAIDDEAVTTVAPVLAALIDAGVLDRVYTSIDDDLRRRVTKLAAGASLAPWFQKVVGDLGPWGAGGSGDGPDRPVVVGPISVPTPAATAPAPSTGDPPPPEP
jgi:hypothetical protein